MYAPAEFILDKASVKIIRRGSCIGKGRVLTTGDAIDDDVVLDTEYLRESMCPKTLTFLEVAALSRSDLMSVCQKHSDFSKQIRTAQIKFAIWRGIIYAARQVKKKGSHWETLWKEFSERKNAANYSLTPGTGEESAEIVKEIRAI